MKTDLMILKLTVPTLVIAASAHGAAAQMALPAIGGGEDPYVTAVRVTDPPRIDGRLDEPFWQSIQPVRDFVQRWPVDGAPASERSEFRVAFDDNNLYFGVTLFDREPDRILASVLQREGPLGERDDRIIIALDTYHDRRNAYIFELNPLGTQGDALITDERMTFSDWNWEGVYTSEGRITEDGWVLEVAIPFTTIRFSAEEAPEMGIAFYRHIQRKQEEATWPAIPLDYRWGIFQVSRYATLRGLSDLDRGNNVQIKPFGIAGAQSINGGQQDDVLEDIGLDVKWGITSSLTMDLTLNTDFAQVEADNVQINLTRFGLFFPEKREFFLERAGLFSFGDSRETEAFFSRRVGISNDIIGGGRITGQLGGLSLGVMSLQTDDSETAPGANNSVVRMRGDVLPRTTVGTIFTNLENSSSHSRTAGADVSVRFLGSSSFRAWAAKVWDSGSSAGGTAAGAARLDLRNDLLAFNAGYQNVGENYSPALGFVRRRDLVRYSARAGVTPRFNGSWARQLSTFLNGSVIEGQGGEKQSSDVSIFNNLRFQSGENARLSVSRKFERLDNPFFIRAGTEIPRGDYTFDQLSVTLSTSQRRALSFRGNLGVGEFFNGNRTSVRASALFRFSNHLSISTELDHNAISLPVANGNFSTNVLSARIEGAASRRLFANALIQYDNVSETMRANVRVDWIHTPGSDLFLVFDTGYFLGDDLTPFAGSRWVNRAVVAKLTYWKAL